MNIDDLSFWFVLFSKANALFEKNAAPILHLAGIDVTVVKVCICFPPVTAIHIPIADPDM